MRSLKNVKLVSTLLLLLSLFLFGCSKDDSPTGPEEVPPPNFSLSSRNVQLQGGAEGIEFYALPNRDVRLVRVDITNPIGQSINFNAGGQVFITGQGNPIALQQQGTAYTRLSGNWNFRFVGNHEPTQEPFDVSQSLSVSAKQVGE